VGARLLADENVPGPAVTALRREGHDAVWMHEEAPGTPDVEVLARAQQEERVVVTFDKDFGELAFRLGVAATFGVVLFRINAESPDAAARAAVAAFATRTDWSGVFVVVEDGHIRVRSLVDPSPNSPADEKA
jgi:predicted nuclease of predicted toxin-antitoxin system